MTASEQKKSPDFFESHDLDPVGAATRQASRANLVSKRKAGFYISADLLERFNRCFHRLKLAGIPIENKSALLELAMRHALEDLDKGERSFLLKKIRSA